MKNQYFGDINDYKKYGLLRAIIATTDFLILVNWMLTPDDGSPDGKFTTYLRQPERYSDHDPELFTGLHQLVAEQGKRYVRAIEETDLLPGARYFSLLTPDDSFTRSEWFDRSMALLGGTDLVLLDPDNGLEVSSVPYGRKRSSKYLYWPEVKRLWSVGKSLLIYQHFIREKRQRFIQRMLVALGEAAPGSFVEAFSTAKVVFLMALQPEHHHHHEGICEAVQSRWGSRIRHWDLVRDS